MNECDYVQSISNDSNEPENSRLTWNSNQCNELSHFEMERTKNEYPDYVNLNNASFTVHAPMAACVICCDGHIERCRFRHWVPLTNTKPQLSFSFSSFVLCSVIPMIPVSERSELSDHRYHSRIPIIRLDWSGYVRGFMREVDTRILISHWCHNSAEYLYNWCLCGFIHHSHTFHLTLCFACADNYCTVYYNEYILMNDDRNYWISDYVMNDFGWIPTIDTVLCSVFVYIKPRTALPPL